MRKGQNQQIMQKLTEKEKNIKLMLVDEMLKEVSKMDLKDLKENYKYMSKDPIFYIKYRAYTEEQVESFTEKTSEELRKYFILGLNMYKINVQNSEYFDIL